jgi:hypothetical protein
MIDAEGPLETDLPGIDVDAAVSRQWSTGVAVVASMRANGDLPPRVVIDLGTNGPISNGDFREMMAQLSGCARVVFVTVHLDRSWQDEVNGVLRSQAPGYPNAVIADWATLAAQHPEWFYSDGTHLPIGGPGASALASLVASSFR